MIDPIDEARNPWTGWVVAIAHGGRYLGRLLEEEGSAVLSPVYELNVKLLKTGEKRDGGATFGILYSCAPVLLLHGWTRMRLPDDVLFCRLETLSLPERQRLMAAAQQGAAIVDELKLASSPIAQPRLVTP